MNDCLKVIFTLDGQGIVYSMYEPLHLDALVMLEMASIHAPHGLSRDEQPLDNIPMPIPSVMINGERVYCASALLPYEDGECINKIEHIRKRLRESRIELTCGSPNLTNGAYRNYDIPISIVLLRHLVGYCRGDRRSILRILRKIKYLGAKRRSGYGKVVDVAVERVDYDWSLERDGYAMRFLPHPNGQRLIRPRPPYWHPFGRVPCVGVGERVN